MLRLRELTPQEVELEPDDVHALVRLTRGGDEARVLHAITPSGLGRHVIVPGLVVGRLRLPSGLVLDIRSRFDLADLSALLGAYVGALTLLRADLVPADENGGLVDVLAAAFVDELDRLAGRGLPKGYVRRTFTRPPFAGRPDVATHLRRHAGRADRLVTQAQRITVDIAVNQVLARALDLLLAAPLRLPLVRARLRSLVPVLAGVERPLDVDRAVRLARPRLPDRCRTAFDLAVLLIRGTSLLPDGLQRDGAAVLFPMPKVWEAYVERVILGEAPVEHRVARQVPVHITDPPDQTTGFADVVEYDDVGLPNTIYDAKYKHHGRPSTDDLFQVFTYCSRLRCERAVLVVPGRGERKTYGMGRVNIEVRGLPVLGPSAQVSGAEHPEGGVAELIPVPLRPGAPSSSELLALERAERLP